MNTPEAAGLACARWSKRILITLALASAGVALTTTTASAQGGHDDALGVGKALSSTTSAVKDVVKHTTKKASPAKSDNKAKPVTQAERPAKSPSSSGSKASSSPAKASHAPARSLGSHLHQALKPKAHKSEAHESKSQTSKSQTAKPHTSRAVKPEVKSVSTKRDHSDAKAPSSKKQSSTKVRVAKQVEHLTATPKKLVRHPKTVVSTLRSTAVQTLQNSSAQPQPAQVVDRTAKVLQPTTKALTRTVTDLDVAALAHRTISDPSVSGLLGTTVALTRPVTDTIAPAVDGLLHVVVDDVVAPVVHTVPPAVPGLDQVLPPPFVVGPAPTPATNVPAIVSPVLHAPVATESDKAPTTHQADAATSKHADVTTVRAAPVAWSSSSAAPAPWDRDATRSDVAATDRTTLETLSATQDTATAPGNSPWSPRHGAPSAADSTASATSSAGSSAAALDASETLHLSTARHGGVTLVAAPVKVKKHPGFSPD